MDTVRVDRWLCAARIYKSRSLAQDGVQSGKVAVNGADVKPHHALRVGDEIHVRKVRTLFVAKVLALAEKRLSPPRARELYDDLSPAPPPKRLAPTEPVVERGAGRPSKRDRREFQRIKRRGH